MLAKEVKRKEDRMILKPVGEKEVGGWWGDARGAEIEKKYVCMCVCLYFSMGRREWLQ